MLTLTLIVVLMILLFFMRVPVVYSIGIASLAYVFIAGDVSPMVVAQRLVKSLDSFPLMAIPFFVLAGRLMNASNATDKIFDFADTIVGRFRGGLGYVNVLASMLFAGMSGSAVADASGLGAVEIKAMTDQGYDKRFSVAVTGASSIIGPIIPPSIPALIYGTMVSVSVGRLFLGGVLPGILLGAAFMIRIFFIAKKRGFPTSQKDRTFKEILRILVSSFPALLLPVILIGGIVVGFFTPTEAAAVSSAYALFLWIVVYKGFTIKRFFLELIETAQTVSVILAIIASCAIFGLVLTRQQVPQLITENLLSISSNPLFVVLLIDVLLLAIGTIIDSLAALIIVTPTIGMIAENLSIDPVFMGIVVILTLMIGLVTPPVGMVTFVLSRVASIPMRSFLRELSGFILMAIVVVIIISFFPGLVTSIPNMIMGASP